MVSAAHLIKKMSTEVFSTYLWVLLAHQSYVDLIAIILLLWTDLHALAFEEAQTNGTNALYTLIYVIDLLREDIDSINQLLVHRLQIRLLSLLRFEHIFKILRHLTKSLSQGLPRLRCQISNLRLQQVSSAHWRLHAILHIPLLIPQQLHHLPYHLLQHLIWLLLRIIIRQINAQTTLTLLLTLFLLLTFLLILLFLILVSCPVSYHLLRYHLRHSLPLLPRPATLLFLNFFLFFVFLLIFLVLLLGEFVGWRRVFISFERWLAFIWIGVGWFLLFVLCFWRMRWLITFL